MKNVLTKKQRQELARAQADARRRGGTVTVDEHERAFPARMSPTMQHLRRYDRVEADLTLILKTIDAHGLTHVDAQLLKRIRDLAEDRLADR